MKFIVGIIFGIFLTAVAGLCVVYSGFINMGATVKPSKIEETIGHELFEKSMEKNAPDKKNPYASTDPEVLASGMNHYRENCVICHAAPGIESSEIAKGMNPAPPPLEESEIQNRSDGELYWTVENGIRMTGMPAFGPTHSADEIWKIVAFVRHIPELTQQEKDGLASAIEETEDHHHETEPKKQTPTQTQTQPQTHSDEDHPHN